MRVPKPRPIKQRTTEGSKQAAGHPKYPYPQMSVDYAPFKYTTLNTMER